MLQFGPGTPPQNNGVAANHKSRWEVKLATADAPGILIKLVITVHEIRTCIKKRTCAEATDLNNTHYSNDTLKEL